MADTTHDPSRTFVLPTTDLYQPGSPAQAQDPAAIAAASGCCEPSTVAAGCCGPSAQPEVECCGSTTGSEGPTSCC